jgi:hypothetical protein
VTGLWTNDRDTLAEALRSGLMPHYLNPVQRAAVIEALLGSGAVRVLDPDNTELVERLRSVITSNDLDTESRIRAVIETLRQP